MHFNQLATHLCHLATQADKLDKQRGAQRKKIFDERLFQCRSRLLAPCVREAKATFETIIREKESKNLSISLAEHLTQKLTDQIRAISLELVALKISNVEVSDQESRVTDSLSVLNQQLTQHQEWETRLIALVNEKQLAYTLAEDKHAARITLNASKDRLNRCQQSKSAIEIQIIEKEQFNGKQNT